MRVRRGRESAFHPFLWTMFGEYRHILAFLFVESEVCLHLPSDSTSRWTPLVFSYALPTTGRSKDFHPLERALAGRTKKSVKIKHFNALRLAESQGFEPWVRSSRTHDFQSCAFDHSANSPLTFYSPFSEYVFYYILTSAIRQAFSFLFRNIYGSPGNSSDTPHYAVMGFVDLINTTPLSTIERLCI